MHGIRMVRPRPKVIFKRRKLLPKRLYMRRVFVEEDLSRLKILAHILPPLKPSRIEERESHRPHTPFKPLQLPNRLTLPHLPTH